MKANKLLAGVIIAFLIILAVYGFIFRHADTTPLTKPDNLGRCTASDTGCIRYKSKYRGISGSAKLNENSHLVVHDLHTGPRQIHLNRLGIIHASADDGYTYSPVNIEMSAWNRSGKASDDMESACRLSDNEVLVAESGRTDKRINGEIIHQDWLGRIFHLRLELAEKSATATVFDIPDLRLPDISEPVFEESNDFPHSKENFEGMACVQINPGTGEDAKYLVIVGERGGKGSHTGSLHWGEYDTGQPLSERKIKWTTSADTQGIVAPGKGLFKDPEWRDISGLHIDARHRLFATAAYDSGSDTPPYQSVLYQLGVVCADQTEHHGKAALCDYTSPARPVLLGTYSVLLTSDHHKFESVAAPGGDLQAGGKLSIGAEDEDDGGVWWPQTSD
jgi:hypothetical protein